MFQISSKSDNKWPSYERFCEIQDGGGGHLGFVELHPVLLCITQAYPHGPLYQISSTSANI